MNRYYRTLIKPDTMPYLPPVRQCYSLRKAQRDYTGDIGIIKRMSDGLVLNVVFNSNNELDTDLVDAFDDGSDLRMIEWFNQGTHTNAVSVTNPNEDLECALLKRNGNYFYLNGKKTLYFEDGGRMWRNVRDLTVQRQNIGIVYAGTTDQWLVGLSLHNSGIVTAALSFTGNKNRSYKFMGAPGTEYQEHSEFIPFNQQQISLGYYTFSGRYQSVNGIIETSPREIFLGSDANNFTTINSLRPKNAGKESYIQEVFTRRNNNFRPYLAIAANKYYNTF